MYSAESCVTSMRLISYAHIFIRAIRTKLKYEKVLLQSFQQPDCSAL